MNSTRKEKNKSERSVFTKETLGVIIVLFTTLCLVCLITRDQVFSAPGQYVSAFLFGAFGYFAYAVAAWGEITGIFLITDKRTGFSAKRKALITFSFLSLVTFLHLLSMGDNGGAGYTFADYISASYVAGEGGVVTASAGGVCTAIIAYPFLTLMQLTGGCVVVGAIFALCVYFTIADFVKSGKSKPEAPEKKLRSSYAPADEIPANPVISGVKEYPAEGVKFDEKRSDQRLFVSNPDDFKLKTKREMAKSDKVSGIKLDFEKNGLGVGKSAESYSGSYKDDLQKKIEYIKTPPKLDLNSDKTIKKYAGETKVSTPIKQSSVSGASFGAYGSAGAARQGGVNPSAIPFREHDGNNAAANDAALRSAYFAGRYAGGTGGAGGSQSAAEVNGNGGYFANKNYGSASGTGANAGANVGANGTNASGANANGLVAAGVSGLNGANGAGTTPADSSANTEKTAGNEAQNTSKKPANYKPTLAERLKAAEEAKKAAEAAGIRAENTANTESSVRGASDGLTGRASRFTEISSDATPDSSRVAPREEEKKEEIIPERSSRAAMVSGGESESVSRRSDRTSALFGDDFEEKTEKLERAEISDKPENPRAEESAERFGGRTGERGRSARAFFEDDSDDAGVSSVIREPRANRILFGDENKAAEESKGFTSRVSADDNDEPRSGDQARGQSRGGARAAFGTGAFGGKTSEAANTSNTPNTAGEPTKPEKVQPPINREYIRPPLDLLEAHSAPVNAPKENHEERMEVIKQTLEEFHINALPQSYVQGPSITRYEIMMPAGVSVKKVLVYDDDLRMRLASKNGVRIEAPIPGKNLVGIEVANKTPIPVGMREVLEGAAGKPEKAGALTFAIGKNLVGEAITDNLAKGPHYLVAGATGSGKSVCLNVMIVSLIMRYSPEELRLILIDPKRVGFRCYEHLPHLMIDEIVTEPQKAIAVLQWAYNEMERRYDVFAACTESVISDIDGYNKEIASDTVPKMPRIVIIVDELADLMETCKKDMEARIRALAQKARAAGVHLVLATQRPSVDIITGTIKANLPSRIALKVMNFADSQTILSQGGAEKLLGNGDMLYKNSSMPECERYQGAWISDREINAVVKYIIEHNAAYFDDELQEFLDKSVHPRDTEVSASEGGGEEDEDGGVNEFFLKALWLAVNSGTVSISQLQRRFQIGYARAGGLVDRMERMGFVSGNEGSKARRVLISREEFIEKFGEMPDAY